MAGTEIIVDSVNDILGMTKNFIPPVSFYRPNMSTLNFNVSIQKMKLQVQIAKPLQKDGGQKSKNYSRDVVNYDYENALHFSIELPEAYMILKNFEKLLKGEYVNTHMMNKDNNQNAMVLDHMVQKMFLNPMKDNAADDAPTLGVSIYHSESKETRRYILRSGHELQMFKTILENFYKFVPIANLISSGVIKLFRTAINEMKNEDNNQNGNQNNSQYSSQNNNQNYTQTPEPKQTNDSNTKQDDTNDSIDIPWDEDDDVDTSMFTEDVDDVVDTPKEEEKPKNDDSIELDFSF